MNGRAYTVTVQQKTTEHFVASIDGDTFELDLVGRNGILTWSLRSGGKAVRVQTRILQNDIVEAWLAGVPFSTAMYAVSLAGHPVQSDKTTQTVHGGTIRALMPGRITSILVNENDQVHAGSPLLILEAMKMQNEISSPTAGRIKSIRIKEGETVKKDALLIEIG